MICDKWEHLKLLHFSSEWDEIVQEVLTLRHDILNTLFQDDFNLFSASEFVARFSVQKYLLSHNAFVNTMAFLPQVDNVYEAHKKFADIHFVLHGSESIEIASVSDILHHNAYNESDIYDEEKDAIFYTKPYPAWARVNLNSSNFLLALPEDAHATLLITQPFCVLHKKYFDVCEENEPTSYVAKNITSQYESDNLLLRSALDLGQMNDKTLQTSAKSATVKGIIKVPVEYILGK